MVHAATNTPIFSIITGITEGFFSYLFAVETEMCGPKVTIKAIVIIIIITIKIYKTNTKIIYIFNKKYKSTN